MKNLSLILNIVLLVAVGVLYYLHFASPKSANSTGSTANEAMLSDLKIAYINADTVLKYYDYLKVNQEQLEAKTQKMDADFRNRAQGLQNEINAYQRSVNSMTIGQVKATEENLAKKQQNLQLYQQTLQQQLMQDEANLRKQLYDRITAFLKTYSAEKGLQVVLKYDPSSDMLYGGNALDISQDVIKGLNDSYKAEKEGTQPKGDSIAKK
ncbi:MAG TPA: OmpH family outer membrane protein [Chryseosolibacter sp.]